MTRHPHGDSSIILAILLGAMAFLLVLAFLDHKADTSEKRALVTSTDDCLKANKRAVMICARYGRCFIECREKAND